MWSLLSATTEQVDADRKKNPMKRALAALTLCLGLIGAAAGPASAAGATAQRETEEWDYCYSIQSRIDVCTEGQSVTKVINKDAGTYLSHEKTEVVTSQTAHTSRRGVPLNPPLISNSSGQWSLMIKFRDGEMTHHRLKSTSVSTGDFSNCTGTSHYHVVHGRVIHDDFESSCS